MPTIREKQLALARANDVWASVFGAYVVKQHADETARLGSPGSAADDQLMARFIEEAESLADSAVLAYLKYSGLTAEDFRE